MPDSLSELTQKYRDEMLRMYRSQNPAPPRPQPPPELEPPKPAPMPQPPVPPPPKPAPPPAPSRPGIMPVSAEPVQPVQLLPPEAPVFVTEDMQATDTPESIPDNDNRSPVEKPEEIQEIVYEEPVLPQYIQPAPPPTPQNWEAQDAYEKRNTAQGKLYVVAATADSAFPVAGARVTIYTKIGDTMYLNYILTTNESGMTPIVTLPAPPAILSQAPENIKPYAIYDIRIYASGYFREEAKEVAIFADVTSRQEFQMIPLPFAIGEDVETIQLPPAANDI